MKDKYNIPIAVTTINHPSKALIKFSKLKNFSLFVAGDRKTPVNWSLKNCIYFSIDDQHKKYPKLSKLVQENTYCRKMFSYLEIIKIFNPEFLYESDDDNIPNSFFPNFLLKAEVIPTITTDAKILNNSLNIYSLFTKEKIWPRGYPLKNIEMKTNLDFKNEKIFPFVQQSLADLDPDVDAIYRLTNTSNIKFDKNKKFALNKNIYCPINTQNTLNHKKIFPLLYLPSTVNNRVTDIWSGYIKQRIIWEINGKAIFLSPSVYQIRNPHDYMNDFACELDLYQKTDSLLKALNEIRLKGNIEDMLFDTYVSLVNRGFFKRSELKILELWLKEIKNI